MCDLNWGIWMMLVATLAVLLALPSGGNFVVMTIIIMVVSSFAIYGMRGMYYAILEKQEPQRKSTEPCQELPCSSDFHQTF